MIGLFRAAWVIGRRDFTAIIFSRAFLFFLVGPLFPVIVGVIAGSLGAQVAEDRAMPVIAVTMAPEDVAAMRAATERLGPALAGRLPDFRAVAADATPRALLADGSTGLAGVLSGSLTAPVLTATPGTIAQLREPVALVVAAARAPALPPVRLATDAVARSAGNAGEARLLTGQAAQALLFLLTMLLAGMVLSNLVEEKANKIIEVLAAAVPIDAVFLGKLFAMLAMALCGIAIWGAVALLLSLGAGQAGLPSLPAPAVGWPVFALLAFVYFSTAYLLIGALFLSIGAMASTVREVQTLSMPVTMLQLINFFFAMYTVTKIGEPVEAVACIFPFTSPFAMIARAAQEPVLWHHGVAIAGQLLFVALVLRIGVILFRRNVMKSGRAGRRARAAAA
jgi:ABC-2 type transport system permease protein